MDEVEIDTEAYNELEAQLYGQIHHEAIAGVQDGRAAEPAASTQQQATGVERIVTSTSVFNRPAGASRVPTSRYWVNGQRNASMSSGSSMGNTLAITAEKEDMNTDISPPNAPDDAGADVVIAQSSVISDGDKIFNNNNNKKLSTEPQKSKQNQTINQNNQNQKEENKKAQKQEQQKQPDHDKPDFRINPFAASRNNKAKLLKKQQQHVARQGPFMQQELKLQKALKIEAKKQKSKRARAKKKQQQNMETIVLESSEESNNDDVIVLPTVPPPTIVVYDSDSAEEKNKKPLKLSEIVEENAMDATDVKLNETSTFSKPRTAAKQTATYEAVAEKLSEQNTSRCTSPCSVLSSDDFIGHTDRNRLMERNAAAADDEDLLLLTADVDSLMQAPSCAKEGNAPQVSTINRNKSLAVVRAMDDTSSSNDVMCTAEFATPLATAQKAMAVAAKKQTQQDYRVEQTEFRALDVYESESDLTDSMYSKGSGRATTIVHADGSSSDDADDIQQVPASQKMKKLRKRRASGSNRSSEAQNDESTNSEADEEEENMGVEMTGVPFIARGPAVERLSQKTHKRSQSFRSRRTSGASGSAGHMSDTEFIATLNSLATGQVESAADTDDEAEEEDDGMANAPSARDIAEKVLQKQNRLSRGEERNSHGADANDSEFCDALDADSVEIVMTEERFAADAVPVDAIADLDKVFHTIDNLEKMKPKTSDDEYVSDYSNSDVEFVSTPVIDENASQMNDTPVYNIIYGYSDEAGGLGWNDEMRKFYNDSWKGENFTVRGAQMKMDQNKNLWKIYTDDRFPKSRSYSNLKCYNCCEMGHTRAKCRRPKKPAVCYMCGESGHYEPRCPNTICLRCGNKTQVFTKSCNACTFQNRLICPICKVRGHAINLCPDKWRRYHSTTEPNEYPNSRVRYNTKKMCCVCGGRGHLPETCRNAVRFMEYPVFVSQIKSHQKSYTDQLLKTHREGIAFNLLYKPNEKIYFRLAQNTNSHNYYGRFLKAVGMDHLLRLKRTRNNDGLAVMRPRKQARNVKNTAQQHTSDPLMRADGADTVETVDITIDEIVPNQVQEVSGSNEDVEMVDSPEMIDVDDADAEELVSNVATASNLPEAGNIENGILVTNEVSNDVGSVEPDTMNRFKTPSDMSAIRAEMDSQEKEPLDSDSNYSFSEHFEMRSPVETDNAAAASEEMLPTSFTENALQKQLPSTSASAANAQTVSRKAAIREMEALPDFIPFNNTTGVSNVEDADSDNVDIEAGISRRFVTDDTDEEDNGNPGPELPCEAKIYITHFHSNYLLSPKGHAFLVQKSKECNIKARLDWTSVGHVLVIFGLPSDQDQFHRELLAKYRELSEQFTCRRVNSAKVPKRADVLIRFLRDNINQLLSNLGNVNDLQRRIWQLEETRTKASLKVAEKCRRSLNMILLGQAGLRDGSMHLNKLLASLKTLINDYHSEYIVPNQLRDEIDAHVKQIFTSYRHDNYPELIECYNKLVLKNRIPKLNIDPLLLGQKMLDTSLTAEQKERLEKSPQKAATQESDNVMPNTQNLSNVKLVNKRVESPPPPAPSMKIKVVKSPPPPPPPPPSMKFTSVATMKQKNRMQISNTPNNATPNKTNTMTTGTKKQSLPAPPFTNPQQKCTAVTKIRENVNNLDTTVDSVFLSQTTKSAAPPTGATSGNMKRGFQPSKGPSVFWSRESMKYLDECIRLAECNDELLQKLQRIQQKAKDGALSYNDYRAVINLHGAMLGN